MAKITSQDIDKYLKDIRCAINLGLYNFDLEALLERLEKCRIDGGQVVFIGNGGSAAICSHMALDFTNASGIKAICFNDGPLLTCLANDYGFDNIFSKAIEMYALKNDILVAISSSGSSADILKGVRAARKLGCYVVTLSGFNDDNPLSRMGDANIHLPISRPQYGKVEVAHYVILHFINDCLNKQKSRR